LFGGSPGTIVDILREQILQLLALVV